MAKTTALVIDQSGASPDALSPEDLRPARDWPPVLITRETIDAEIERLECESGHPGIESRRARDDGSTAAR